MKLSNTQKRAVEKITGKAWDSWSPATLESYFLFTERGIKPSSMDEELQEIISLHKHHAAIVEMWKVDFKKGLLTLWDFLLDDTEPAPHIEHVFDVYYSLHNYIPTCYCSHLRTPKRYKR